MWTLSAFTENSINTIQGHTKNSRKGSSDFVCPFLAQIQIYGITLRIQISIL